MLTHPLTRLTSVCFQQEETSRDGSSSALNTAAALAEPTQLRSWPLLKPVNDALHGTPDYAGSIHQPHRYRTGVVTPQNVTGTAHPRLVAFYPKKLAVG